MPDVTAQLPPDWPEWCKPSELAERWRCSVDTVIRHIEAGRVKAIKAGGWRIHRSAIEAFERGAKTQPRPPKYRTSKPVMRDRVAELEKSYGKVR